MRLVKEFEVRKARDAKGWSQVELAARSRVSSRTISEIETKPRKQISETVLIKVAIGLEGDGGRDAGSGTGSHRDQAKRQRSIVFEKCGRETAYR